MADPFARLQFRKLQDRHPLRIEAARGASSTMVVSMTSVGKERGAWPAKEFVWLSSDGGQNHVMCVTDISRSWMNGPGLVERITDAISDYVLKHRITELIGIGTSMGAYNLLVQGRFTPFTRIIALSPQFSVHPEIVPDETRWRFFRNQIADWPHPKIVRLPKPPCEIVMAHGDTDDEQRHWRRIPEAENLRHFIFPDTDHNFPRHLTMTGDLAKVVRPAMMGHFLEMQDVITALGAEPRATYERRDQGAR